MMKDKGVKEHEESSDWARERFCRREEGAA
jgi:hypothetical protein